MRLLVTGSNGFLGSSLGQLAIRDGCEVLGIGRSSQPIPVWAGRYFQQDVAHSDLRAVIDDFAPDVVLHAAGAASVGLSFATPLDDLRGAILTWANILDALRRSGQRPIVIFPSSAAVYGNPTKLPVGEENAIAPISPYGFHKAACELLGREYAECFGLDIIVCRLFSVFGVAQRRLLIWELYQQLVGSDTVWLQGSGTESRDYLAIDDIWTAVFHLIENSGHAAGKGHYLVLNVARGEEVMVRDVAQELRTLIAPDKSIHCHGIERPGDPQRWCADLSRLHSLIPDWRPKPFSLALSQCVAAWQEERKVPSYEAAKRSGQNRHC
jgi:UDP-glucose 4-epimerase